MSPTTFFFLLLRPPPTSTLFPYTTLFRSLLLGVTHMALKKGVDVKPATGKLGILLPGMGAVATTFIDRKSTRLNSSHVEISYAVFCLKKKSRKAPGRHNQSTGRHRLCGFF